MNHRLLINIRPSLLPLFVLGAMVSSSQAFEPPEQRTSLQAKQFFERELYLSSSHEKLEIAALRQRPGDALIDGFFETHGSDFRFYMDPRSGTMSNVIGRVPLIPGTGLGNKRTLESVSADLGRPVGTVDEEVVGEVVRAFIARNSELIGIDASQLGTTRTTRVTDTLWQISIPQQVDAVPVRHGRIVATINHGNLVLLGTESWGNASLDTQPTITAEQALALGFTYAEGTDSRDEIWQEPTLEVVPYAPPEHQSGEAFAGPVGQGYGHRLVWSFGFRRPPGIERWEILVDAHSGEVISFEDANHYATEEIVGGVYPLTSTEICPTNETCGTMQPDQPMPFADTGLLAPNNYTNSAGLYDFTGAETTTNLDGQYVRIQDTCGFVEESTTQGRLDLAGVNGDHDCTSAGDSPGDTASARSCFYELNKLAEMGRGGSRATTG